MAIALLALVMIWTLAPPNGAADVSDSVVILKAAVEKLQTNHDDLQKKIDVLNAPIYFMATFQQYTHTVPSGTVVFNKELENTGCPYNPLTGFFTAPRQGDYVFAVQTFPRGRADANWDLHVNDRMALRSRSIAGDDTSNAYVFPVFLRTGDKVAVQSRFELNIYGQNHSFFAGWLLKSG